MIPKVLKLQGGFAATDQITWYHNSGLLTTGMGSGAATINVQTTGVGSYYATVTNSHCTSTTNTFYVTNNCGGCVASQVVDATVESNLTCQQVIAHPTALPAGYTNVSWSASLPGATILSNDATAFEAENVAPGEYPLQFTATYDNGSQLCSTTKNLSFIIPYKANLKYELSCGSGNTYNVKLVDFSTYYAGTPITQWWFTIDGGTNWYTGTAGVGGIREFNTALSSGTYTIGIRIATPGYAACEEFLTLTVPNKPNADFTNAATACAGSPIHFTLSNPQPGYQYSWDFGDLSTNLQPNPSKSYDVAGLHAITLTVSDQYGCTMTSMPPHVINVKSINMGGSIQMTPANVCQGGQATINFLQNPGTDTPTTFNWFQNTVTQPPFAISTSSNLSVTQNGSYLVYLIDSNGCEKNNLDGATVAFTPLPETPVISGNASACANSLIKLKVPANSSVTYVWSLNGVVQPQWNNQNNIVDVQSTAGTYIYSVVATVLAGGTTYCSSVPGTFGVTVVPAPDVPIISLSTVVCIPYQVEVTVSNPQTDVGYYWSNGGTGASTVMSHDGPLQVRAVLDQCESKSQIDLPIDLEALAWIFPKGCFESCDKPDGYIIGPNGSFESWQWLDNDSPITTGNGEVQPLTNLTTTNYSMYLSNGYCEQTTGYASFTGIFCDHCEFRYEVRKVTCVKINNQNVYQVELSIVNPYSGAAYATLTVPNGEGSFVSNSLTLPSGVSTHFLYFNGQFGFNGGSVTIHTTAYHDGKDCTQDFTIEFPESCESVEECNFGYKVGKINCVKTETGNIYRFELEITNPYAINATTTVSVPSTIGTVSPASIVSPSGVVLHSFYFYPVAGSSPAGIPVTVTTTIGTVVCTKFFDVKLPSSCDEVKKCDFRYESVNVECHQMLNGQYGYTVSMIITNPYSTPATLNLSALNHEGYFIPSVLNLVVGSSLQTFDFYPNGGFVGGTVNVTLEGHYKDQICLSELRIRFPRLCCPTCRVVDLDDPIITAKNLLIVAPNPASDNTTIFYNFVETGGNQTIVLTDLLGRTLLEWHPNDAKGTLEVDCSRYAQGQYLILMKQDNAILENTKLIKH